MPLLGLTAVLLCATTHAQNRESVHYQGRLKDVGAPVSGQVDLGFRLYSAATGGALVGQPVTRNAVPVVDGVFSVALDFDPDLFQDRDLWLEVEVSQNGSTPVVLAPRQELTATPFALRVRGMTFDAGGGQLVLGESEEQVAVGIDQPQFQLHVRDRRSSGSHVAMFDNDSGDSQADGIQIRIDNGLRSTNRDNNFLTFLNGQDVVVGRVEGFDVQNGDWIAPPPLPNLGLSFSFDPGRLPTASLSGGRLPSATFAPGRFPVLSCTNGAWPQVRLSGGVPPSASFSPGSLPTLTFRTQTILGFRVPTSVSWSTGTLPSSSFNAGTFPAGSLTGGQFPTCTLSRGTLPSLNWNPGVFPTLSFDPGALPVFRGASINLPTLQELTDLICWASEHGTDHWLQIALAYGLAGRAGASAAQLAVQAQLACQDDGVVYGSKGADYAEWLPKADPAAQFQLGQVVGIRGGEVTLETDAAEQLMVISCKPVVLGNVPADEDVDAFVKVAFMGQVPVVVRGGARAGDYVLPSGLGDGTAIAVRPDALTVDMIDRIVGRAWSDSDDPIYGLVNVVVGVHANEVAPIVREQQVAIDELSVENARLRAELEELHAGRVAIDERLSAIERVLAAEDLR